MDGNDTSGRFDPARYVRRLRGRGGPVDSLDVKWRLVWLRHDHPDALISTELVTFTDDLAIFKAVVSVPGGGSASGYGSETARDFADYIEKAETKALGRALAALGFGTQFARDFEDDATSGSRADERAGVTTRGAAPARHAPSSAAADTERPVEPASRAEPAASTTRRAAPVLPLREGVDALEPASARESIGERVDRPVVESPRGSRQAPSGPTVEEPGPRPMPSRQPTALPAARPSLVREDAGAGEGQIDIANYGWTEFWNWARSAGYANRDMLDAAAGRSTQGLTPLEIRRLILDAPKGR